MITRFTGPERDILLAVIKREIADRQELIALAKAKGRTFKTVLAELDLWNEIQRKILASH